VKPFKKILQKFDTRKFKKPTGDLESMYTIAYWNLWNQFGVTPKMVERAKKQGKEIQVVDYAWTKKAKEQYYAHPYTQLFMKKLDNRGMAHGMWVLQAEPSDYEDHLRWTTEKAAREKVAQSK